MEKQNKISSLTRKVWKRVPLLNFPDSEGNISDSSRFRLGPINLESLIKDPKHLAFTLSRYKFAAKMMKECNNIMEIGCGEGIGALMFLRETNADIIAMDFDESQIRYAKEYILPHTENRVNFTCQDIITKPYKGKKVDGMVCIDVLEHIHPDEQEQFLKNYVSSLNNKGISIIGTPNKDANKKYGYLRSKKGHINLFNSERLRSTLEKYFTHTFLFSMNDEVVHTGYDKMAHYLIAISIK